MAETPMQQELLVEEQIKFTVWTHEELLKLGTAFDQAIIALYQPDQTGQNPQVLLINRVETLWGDYWQPWVDGMNKGRYNGAALGVLGGIHLYNEYSVPLAGAVLAEQIEAFNFEELILEMMRDTAEFVYPDDLNLSDRLWKTDREIREELRRIILEAAVTGTSAADLSEELSEYVGASDACVQQTTDCSEKGIAAKTLRIARNEIQTIHHRIQDEVYDNLPFVEKEQILLSPAHPPWLICVCVSVVGGGEGGQGIYPLGEVTLPLHVRCLCYRVSILMDETEYTNKLRAWLGGETWAEMDKFINWAGLQPVDLDKSIPFNVEEILLQY